MAADEPAADTDDGATVALRKRHRRVSFAEITSVHVFHRDDESDTPPDPKPEHDHDLEQLKAGILLADEREGGEDDGDGDGDGRLFLRPAESPASTAGSDDDNFFGPVSTSFIRPGRLSDSGASDSHDITMDSTAFSQHFRSLAKSDSGGDLKTPTGVHLSFEENTPSQNTIPVCNLGSSMFLNLAKKPMSASSTSIEKLSGGSDSNDMSLVQENPNRYDYGRLSFEWDALLAEGVKDSNTDEIIPVSNENIITQSPFHPQSMLSPSMRCRERIEPNESGVENLDPTESDQVVVELAPFADKLDFINGARERIEYNHTRNENLHVADTNHVIAEVAPFAGELNDVNEHSESMVPDDTSGKKVSHTHTDHVMVEVPPFHDKLVGANGDCISSSILRPNLVSSHELNRSPDLLIKQSNESPLARSLASLSKRRQTVLQGARVSKTLLTSTPQNHVLSESDGIRRAETVPSVQKSISKLRMLDASPFASNLNVKMNSILKSSESLYRTPPGNTSLHRNKDDAEIKNVDASAAWRDKSRILAQGNRERNTISNTKLNSVAISGNLVDESFSTGLAGRAKFRTSPASRSTEVLASEQSSDLARVKNLLFQLTWSGKKTKMNLLTSGDPTGRIFVTPGKDSFFAKITHDHPKIIKAAGTHDRSVDSLKESVIKKSASREFHAMTTKDDESKIKIVDNGYDVDRRDNVRNASLSTTIVKELDSAFREIAHSSPPLSETNLMKECTQLETTSPLETEFHDVQVEARFGGSSQHCLTNEDSRYLILNRNLETGKDPELNIDLTGECLKSSCASPPPPPVNMDDSDPSSPKKLMGSSCQIPLREMFYSMVHDDRLNSAALGKPFIPNDNQLACEYEDVSARKRTREDVICGESVYVDEIGRLQRSPKVHKSVGREFEVLPERRNRSNIQPSIVGHEPTLEHWTDVLSKLVAKKMLPPSTDRLHLQAISVLEDKLVKLQRLQTYQMHHNVIQSQKSVDNLANLQHKKVGETKMLVQRIMLEHAKLQLMCVKQERLERNVQLLRHGIQESQLLKLNYLPHISAGCIRDPNTSGNHCQSINIRGRGEEVPVKKVTELRQLRDTLESEFTPLTKSVHTSCKLKGISNPIDTISAVNGFLKKKACCKFLRSDLQLWKVHNIFTMNGNRNMVLNYLDFVTQRITIKTGSASNVVISNELNDGTMLKCFPNMDAWIALSFVINAKATQKYVGSPSLTRETQITSTVLGNLVDIAEEVQQARLELQNLTYIRFVSPSVGQLDLHFHFVGLKSGRKMAMTLDMSCLKWGIYPSDTVPYKLGSSSEHSRETLPEQLSAEIRAAVQSLSVGYWRILRICTAVSQVVQAWRG